MVVAKESNRTKTLENSMMVGAVSEQYGVVTVEKRKKITLLCKGVTGRDRHEETHDSKIDDELALRSEWSPHVRSWAYVAFPSKGTSNVTWLPRS